MPSYTSEADTQPARISISQNSTTQDKSNQFSRVNSAISTKSRQSIKAEDAVRPYVSTLINCEIKFCIIVYIKKTFSIKAILENYPNINHNQICQLIFSKQLSFLIKYRNRQ